MVQRWGGCARSWAAAESLEQGSTGGPSSASPWQKGETGLQPALKNTAVWRCHATSAKFTRGGACGRGKWERGGEPSYVARVLQPSFLRPGLRVYKQLSYNYLGLVSSEAELPAATGTAHAAPRRWGHLWPWLAAPATGVTGL